MNAISKDELLRMETYVFLLMSRSLIRVMESQALLIFLDSARPKSKWSSAMKGRYLKARK